jgi:four helix bundle protein
MKIQKFEDLPVWQESIDLGKEIYLLTSSGRFEKDYSFKDQIRKAVISISSNIAEGFERSNNNEFIRFLLIAKGSLGEVRSQLYFAFVLEYINRQSFDNMNSRLELLAKQIGSFISYLKKAKKDGNFTNK